MSCDSLILQINVIALLLFMCICVSACLCLCVFVVILLLGFGEFLHAAFDSRNSWLLFYARSAVQIMVFYVNYIICVRSRGPMVDEARSHVNIMVLYVNYIFSKNLWIWNYFKQINVPSLYVVISGRRRLATLFQRLIDVDKHPSKERCHLGPFRCRINVDTCLDSTLW